MIGPILSLWRLELMGAFAHHPGSSWLTRNCAAHPRWALCLSTVITSVALIQGVAIYRCRFTSPLLPRPVLTDPAASSDGFTVVCVVPDGTYPAGVAAGSLEMSVELLEGAVSGNAGNVIPWGHGQCQ